MYNAGVMVKRLEQKLLLSPDDFSPTDSRLEVIGTFNPGAVRHGDDVILLVRVAQGCSEKREGYVRSPRMVLDQDGPRYEIDELKTMDEEWHPDHRKPLLEDGVHRRLAFVSHLELVRLSADGYTVRNITRLDNLMGSTSFEEYGVEDPRITKIGDVYYITYVAVSNRMGVSTCLMSTRDFVSFERHGIIFPKENKDVVLFPERIGDLYRAYHRPVGRIDISELCVVSASSPDLLHWGDHQLVLACSKESAWYNARIGAGTPPVKTEKGWLSIFHGVQKADPADPIGVYAAGAMLTALDDPARLIAVSAEPFLKAEADYELAGYVNNVVFPTGVVPDRDDPDRIHVYYGCADSCIAVATFSVEEILLSLDKGRAA